MPSVRQVSYIEHTYCESGALHRVIPVRRMFYQQYNCITFPSGLWASTLGSGRDPSDDKWGDTYEQKSKLRLKEGKPLA